MIRLLRRFLADPRTIGAIAPSSPMLAAAMARQINPAAAVFEIGAGTGAITKHIPRTSHSMPLVVFEQDRYLAKHLRCRVGHALVIEGLFHDTVTSLGELPDRLDILSSVPFNSLPGKLHLRTIEAICGILLASPRRRLIQYSYFNRPPFDPRNRHLHWSRLVRVWANLPPATVWELRALDLNQCQVKPKSHLLPPPYKNGG